MMEHVQEPKGKVQHLADVPTRSWRKATMPDGSKLQLTGNVTTLCGRTLAVAARLLENPQDCKRCRKVASTVDEVS